MAIEGTIFAFGFLKKYDLSFYWIVGQVLDQCRAFNRLSSVDAHLWKRERLSGLENIIKHPSYL
jgi:hypothetical protein